MSMLALQASIVVTEHPEKICHFVGFANGPEASENYLLLQRDFESIDDGTDTPHLEWCGQRWSGYGLIESAVLGAEHLEVMLSVEGMDLLGGVTHVRVSFSIPQEGFLQLKESLTHIFRGTGDLHLSNT